MQRKSSLRPKHVFLEIKPRQETSVALASKEVQLAWPGRFASYSPAPPSENHREIDICSTSHCTVLVAFMEGGTTLSFAGACALPRFHSHSWLGEPQMAVKEGGTPSPLARLWKVG